MLKTIGRAKKFMDKIKFLMKIDAEYKDYYKYISAMSKEQMITFIQEFGRQCRQPISRHNTTNI